MAGAERIVFAFVALGKAGQTTAFAQRQNTVAPSGQNFVRIGLVPNIPNQPVFWRIENMMESDRQFDNAQAGSKVSAGNRHSSNDFFA